MKAGTFQAPLGGMKRLWDVHSHLQSERDLGFDARRLLTAPGCVLSIGVEARISVAPGGRVAAHFCKLPGEKMLMHAPPPFPKAVKKRCQSLELGRPRFSFVSVSPLSSLSYCLFSYKMSLTLNHNKENHQ